MRDPVPEILVEATLNVLREEEEQYVNTNEIDVISLI